MNCLRGLAPQQISYLEVHEQVGRRAGGSGSNIGRHKVSRNVAGRNSSEDQLSDFSHGSGGCDVGFPCNPAYDKRQKEGDENGETAHPVGNVKGSVGQVAERDEEMICPARNQLMGVSIFSTSVRWRFCSWRTWLPGKRRSVQCFSIGRGRPRCWLRPCMRCLPTASIQRCRGSRLQRQEGPGWKARERTETQQTVPPMKRLREVFMPTSAPAPQT